MYVLGKLVNRDRSQPSSAFHPTSNGGIMYVRVPMPAERRRCAPWLAPSPARSGTPRAAVVRNAEPVLLHRQSGQSSRLDDAKHQTAIRIIDGGEVTTIQDDRRDVDYLVQSGASVLRPPSGFASNTNRDARWGTDPTSQAPRTAQAPHYGISRHRVMN